MLKLLLVCTLAASATADVSHLVRNNRPFGAPPRALPVAPKTSIRSPGDPVAILREHKNIEPDGSYEYGFEAENGIAVDERAEIRALGRSEEVEKVAQGSYSWTSPEGERISIAYVADGNGFQPQGSHLPVAPPIPVAIQRALEWIASHPQPVDQNENVSIGRRRF